MECYTPEKLRETVEDLRPLFDVVRLVDPTDSAVLELAEMNCVLREPHTCYRLWNRNSRCENCSSLRAAQEGTCETKCEWRGNERFIVFSRPLLLKLPWRELPMVLEIGNRLPDTLEEAAPACPGCEN